LKWGSVSLYDWARQARPAPASTIDQGNHQQRHALLQRSSSDRRASRAYRAAGPIRYRFDARPPAVTVNVPAGLRYLASGEAAWESPQEIDSAARDRQSVNGLFRVFLPLGGARRVLTDANGIGATALSLAALGGRVVCLCPDAATARLVRIRAHRDGVQNVHPVVAAVTAVPGRSSSVDHISLHRIEPPGASTVLATELSRVLADGASLFLSFERRRVPAGPIRLTPWRLRSAVRALRRRLRVRALVYHFPSLDRISLVQYVDRRRWRMADRWLTFRRSVTGTNLGVVFVKPPLDPEAPHMLEQIREHVARLTGGVPTPPCSVFFGTGGSLVADMGSTIVRLPQHDAAAGRCTANLAALTRLAEGPGLALAPLPLGEGTVHGQRFFLESRLRGVSMDEEAVKPAVREAIREQAIHFLMDKPALFIERACHDTVRALVDREFGGIAPFLDQAGRDMLRRTAERMSGILADGQVPMVVHHGDFKSANFRYETSPRLRLTGIVDWDLASIPGFPLLDLLTLHFDVPGASVADLPRSLHTLAQGADVPPVVQRYAIHWSLGECVVRELALFANVKHLNRHFHFSLRTRPAWQALVRTTLLAAG
jgi:hypothetical protein